MVTKNPLRHRLPRELRTEFGKYAVIFILLVASIGFVSGFLVADDSMIAAYNESFEKYNIENGHFRLNDEMNRAQRKAVDALGITVYDNYYIEEALTNESTLRIYANREQVNKVCLMEGELPQAADEIAIDRMYADNNSLTVGDTIASEGHEWTVTGLVALSDYSCLFADNDDSMFDSIKFGVAIVTAEGFAQLDADKTQYCYSWIYDDPPADDAEEKEVSEDLMDALGDEVHLQEFLPRYLNQAITFTGEDMGSDRAMMTVLLYIIIVIMAFVFGITARGAITKESCIIGTLRASGFTRGELLRHYMAMPVIVTIISAIVGNILGYTWLKDVCAGMYYGSYSLPTYVTLWNADAFVMTTVIPVILMLCVNALVLWSKLSLSPLKFLRRDLSRREKKRALPLSTRLPFLTRFRLRVIFQNVGSYVILFIGILFANLLLLFGLIFPSVLAHYQNTIQDNMLCNYQYMLTVPLDATDDDHMLESMINMMLFQSEVETETGDAEKFSVYSLQTTDDAYPEEAVTLYGVQEDSRYVQGVSAGDVLISSAYADKTGLGAGDTITLKERYEDDIYEFTITGIYDYMGAIAVFMNIDALNETFDYDDDYFCGYLSDTEITDIDEQYIGSVIDLDALTKVSRQLDVSMGSMMYLVQAFAMLIFVVLVYLLSKLIIEKNAQSVSMTKILGYTNREISGLYIRSTSIVVVLFLLISLPIENGIMYALFKGVMMQMISGWIPYYLDPMLFVEMMAMGIATYAVVAALEFRKIRAIPMDEALKNVE